MGIFSGHLYLHRAEFGGFRDGRFRKLGPFSLLVSTTDYISK